MAMTGTELVKKLPLVTGFFIVDGNIPGYFDKNRNGWVFDGDDFNPRPITKSEYTERGGAQETADFVAELLSDKDVSDINEIATVAGSKKSRSFSIQVRPATKRVSGRTKAG